MKTAVRTPTNAVTAKATVGNGVVSPKFCKGDKKKGIKSSKVLAALLFPTLTHTINTNIRNSNYSVSKPEMRISTEGADI